MLHLLQPLFLYVPFTYAAKFLARALYPHVVRPRQYTYNYGRHVIDLVPEMFKQKPVFPAAAPGLHQLGICCTCMYKYISIYIYAHMYMSKGLEGMMASSLLARSGECRYTCM